MAIDPQVAIPATVALALLSLVGQIITHFTKQSKEPENGYHKQVDINTANIASLETDMRNAARVESIRSLEIDMRDVTRRLGTMEEQVKTNVLEILTIRPRIHQMGNDVQHLLFVEKERRERDRKQ